MRRLFTAGESGLSRSALRWGEQCGRWLRLERGVYLEGGAPPSELDRARARVLAAGSVARGTLAGVLHGLDGVVLDGRPTRRSILAPERVVRLGGVPCADGFQTLVDLAAVVDDLVWEQALESALRSRLTSVVALEAALPGLPPPIRQFEVVGAGGDVVARLDLCWPELGLSIELGGQQHARPTRLRRPAGNGRGRGDGVAVRALHLARGRPPPTYDGSPARRLADQARRRPLRTAS